MAVMTATMVLRLLWLHRSLASGASSTVTVKMISGHGFNQGQFRQKMAKK
jgi:hypothetical protein